jgi:hypothetical protein
LPIAKKIKDLDSIAHIRFSCAQIRLNRGGVERGEIQEIYEELAESFALFLKIQRLDGIAYAGMLLGQVLAIGGNSEEALKILDESAAAFEKLQLSKQAKSVRELQETIRKEK